MLTVFYIALALIVAYHALVFAGYCIFHPGIGPFRVWLVAAMLALASGAVIAAEPALDLVNAQRAAKGMRPYLPDAGLQNAANTTADYRAANGIKGHTRDDFAALYPGVTAPAAGCACWAAGFGSCCMFENWRYCGAAFTVGKDGLRYCHVYVSNTPTSKGTPGVGN